MVITTGNAVNLLYGTLKLDIVFWPDITHDYLAVSLQKDAKLSNSPCKAAKL